MKNINQMIINCLIEQIQLEIRSEMDYLEFKLASPKKLANLESGFLKPRGFFHLCAKSAN